jgi:hypothetical protein
LPAANTRILAACDFHRAGFATRDQVGDGDRGDGRGRRAADRQQLPCLPDQLGHANPALHRKRDLTTACRYAATAWGVSGRQFQGMRSSIRLIGRSAMRAMTSAS